MNTGWSAGEDDSGQKISDESVGGKCGRAQDEEMKWVGEKDEAEDVQRGGREGEGEGGRGRGRGRSSG